MNKCYAGETDNLGHRHGEDETSVAFCGECDVMAAGGHTVY